MHAPNRTSLAGLRYPAAVASVLAALSVLSQDGSLRAQAVGVTGFNDHGWNADDVRTAAGANIVNETSHAPHAGATLDSDAVAAQIDWRNLNGSFGNLGGVFLTGTSTGNGKSTISVINPDAGFASTADALGSNFQAVYRWQNTDTVEAGISFKIGIQSTAWASSQTDFTATRSGEAVWDLILVADPTYNSGGNTTTNGAFVTSVVDANNTKFKIFAQAGNNYFVSTNPALAEYLGGSAPARTLAEWKALDQDLFGGVIFGEGSKITNTQFGFGSGNQDASGILDFASISYLQNGALIDFVDAVHYTGPGSNFTDSDNWGGNTPDSVTNLIVETNATLQVDGAASARSVGIISGTTTINLNAGSTLALNRAENGTLSAAPGATVSVQGAGTLSAGTIEAAGTINLASKIELNGGDVAHPVRDGGPAATSRYGLVVAEGGVVNLLSGADIELFNNTGANGLKTMVRVGEAAGLPAAGTLNIQNGSSLSIGSLHGTGSWGALHVGDWGGEGVVNQTGGTVDIFGALNIGNEGGVGTYNLSSGEVNVRRPVADNGAIIIGRATNNRTASGTLNVSGDAVLTLGASGGGGNGKITMLLGGLSENAATYSGGTGVVNQAGGLVRFENANLVFGRGNGTYNLDGGTLQIGGTNGISSTPGGTYAFNLGGGTLQVINSDLTTSIDFNVVDTNPNPGTGANNVSTSLIDTNGFNATFSGALSGEGILVKIGDGTLTLSGNNNLTGETYVSGGGVHQTAGTSAIKYLAVGSGTGMTGTYQMTGGSIDVAQALQVGDWGGTGTFSQSGGTITIGTPTVGASLNIGNQGGTGTFNLSGGTLNIVAGFANLGRSTQADVAGDGVLNISGTGVFEVGSLASGDIPAGLGDLIIGDRDGTGLEGNGFVNQSGGTLRVYAGSELWLGAYGHGTYNLNGGTLEIGGSSLVSNYGSGGGGYSFNLGGGTIKVIGSALTTSVNANLAEGTADRTVASVIDTNGLGATWSGAITGEKGGLVKTGLGNLTLSGNVTRSIGYLNSDQGSIIHTAGTTNTTEFVVGSNYGVTDGAFTLSGGTINVTGTTQAASTPSFRVGDWGGTGEFTQIAGTINAYGSVNVGNRGGSGVYNLSGGTLNIGEGASGGVSALTLGRGRTEDNADTVGVFNATGGTLRLFANAPLLVGGDTFPDPNNARSSGTFTQSGTAQVIVDSYIAIGANGTGVYNLNGGVLEVGGSGGIQKGSGSATLNFGGGTLKVRGANLTTNVSPTLTAATTSTIDTNGFNATFSGGLSGSGNLTKVGAGKLTVGGATSTGAFTVAAGTAEFTGNSLGFQSVTVQTGAILSGTGSLSLAEGSTLTIEIGGLADFGKVSVGSTFNASNSTLNIVFVNGFAPTLGDTFDVLDFTSFGGSFAQVQIGAVAGHYWDLSRLTEDGSLSLNAIPEPSSFALLAAAAAVGATVTRRRRRS